MKAGTLPTLKFKPNQSNELGGTAVTFRNAFRIIAREPNNRRTAARFPDGDPLAKIRSQVCRCFHNPNTYGGAESAGHSGTDLGRLDCSPSR